MEQTLTSLPTHELPSQPEHESTRACTKHEVSVVCELAYCEGGRCCARLPEHHRRERVLVNPTRSAQLLRVGLALAIVLALGTLAGCSPSKPAATTPTTPTATPAPTVVLTAKQAYAVAISSLSSSMPDGKLLVAQTAAPITPTSTPVWEFLIGSPKTDKIYAVMVPNGQAQSQPYGNANLKAAEWASIPTTEAWKIDSDAAVTKALAVHPNGKSAGYFMGFVTYVPKAKATSDSQTMQWIVSFDPKAQGKAPTSTVNVSLTTGVAAYAK
jgi:hypothetical protein